METKLIEILNEIKKLSDKIQTMSNSDTARRSSEINELCSALAKAQGEFKFAKKNQINMKRDFNSDKYADMTAIVQAAKSALSENGLSVAQPIIEHSCGSNYLHTLLMHTSGQWIESIVKLVPSQDDIDAVESNLICMKRHAYSSITGIVLEGEDDDGAADSALYRQKKARGTELNHEIILERDQSYKTITKDQLEELKYEIGEYDDIALQILKGMNIKTLANIPKDKFIKTIKRVRELIQEREKRGS